MWLLVPAASAGGLRLRLAEWRATRLSRARQLATGVGPRKRRTDGSLRAMLYRGVRGRDGGRMVGRLLQQRRKAGAKQRRNRRRLTVKQANQKALKQRHAINKQRNEQTTADPDRTDLKQLFDTLLSCSALLVEAERREKAARELVQPRGFRFRRQTFEPTPVSQSQIAEYKDDATGSRSKEATL